jgi:hypothetical protein
LGFALYRNGALKAGANCGVSKRLQARRACTAKVGDWGRDKDTHDKLHVQIDAVAIFDRALTAEHIEAIYRAGRAGMCYTDIPAPTFVVKPLRIRRRPLVQSQTSKVGYA